MQGATDNSEEACLSRKSTIQLINMSQWSPSNIYIYNKGGFFSCPVYHGNGPCATCITGRLIYLKIGYFSPSVAAEHEPNIAARPPARDSACQRACVCVNSGHTHVYGVHRDDELIKVDGSYSKRLEARANEPYVVVHYQILITCFS